jgi:hypothetical protein
METLGSGDGPRSSTDGGPGDLLYVLPKYMFRPIELPLFSNETDSGSPHTMIVLAGKPPDRHAWLTVVSAVLARGQ